MKILAVSVGNTFRRDDGVGSFILQAVRQAGHSGVSVLEHRGEGVDLIEQWQGFDTTILFDAVSSGARPGTIHRFEIPKETLPKSVFCCSTHAFSIADVIELAKTLDRLPAHLIIYGVEGRSFETGQGLSSEVKDAAGEVIARAMKDIQQLTENRHDA